jgi:hypothetical protein
MLISTWLVQLRRKTVDYVVLQTIYEASPCSVQYKWQIEIDGRLVYPAWFDDFWASSGVGLTLALYITYLYIYLFLSLSLHKYIYIYICVCVCVCVACNVEFHDHIYEPCTTKSIGPQTRSWGADPSTVYCKSGCKVLNNPSIPYILWTTQRVH